MSSLIGKLFTVSTYGESHGAGIGAVVDGCPAGLSLSESDIQPQLDRRRPGQSSLTTTRQEGDCVKILSGTENGITLGTPISMMVENKDQRPGDYNNVAEIPRPSHADYTYRMKYGVAASSGGGRASARETVGRVLGGAVADKMLIDRYGIEIVAWVSSIADIDLPDMTAENVSRADVDASKVRCPDICVSERMAGAISAAMADKDSLGGVVTCVCRNVPAGWGEPVFDKMEAALGAAMLSIPAVKGFEVGSGFAGSRMRGSEHNDMFVGKGTGLGTLTNMSGGIQGGITNGEPVVMRIAFKPVASIAKAQETVDFDGNSTVLELKGRHDPCVVSRAVPIVEAMSAIVLADMSLIAD